MVDNSNNNALLIIVLLFLAATTCGDETDTYFAADKNSEEFFNSLDPIECPDFKRYTDSRELKSTIHGTTFTLYDTVLGVDVVVKESRINFRSRPKGLEDPEQEWKFLRVLSHNYGHPNVTRLLGASRTKDKLSLVLEMGGFELLDVIMEEGKKAEVVVKKLFYQIMQGVAFMHSRGIAHLDLSPENILVSEAGEIKIIDFGQARFMKYSRDAKGKYKSLPFPAGQKPGKTQYQAPEIFQGKSFEGTQADVWCCGVILFVCLFGTVPYSKPCSTDRFFTTLIQGRLTEPSILKSYNDYQKTGSNVSVQAATLITQMCSVSNKRISVEQVLAHPWLAECRAT